MVPDINNPFFGEVIKGISEKAASNNYNIMLFDTDENPQNEIVTLKKIKTMKIAGLIVVPTSDDAEFNSEYLKLLEGTGIPTCLLDRDVKYCNLDGVFIDNINAAYEAVNVLFEEGHREIAVIAGPKYSKPGRERLMGYEKVFLSNNLKINTDLVFIGDFKQGSGYEMMNKILEIPKRPTAVFVCNNLMAIGALQSIMEHNLKIPDDISFIMFDHIQMLDILGFKISYVHRPTVDMGRTVMDMLMKKVSSKYSEEPVAIDRRILKARVELRGSEIFIKR